MKKIFIGLFLVSFAIVSCDKRNDYYATSDKEPTSDVVLTNTWSIYTSSQVNGVITDSLKMSRIYRFNLNIADENQVLDFQFNGPGTLVKNGVNFTSADKIETGVHQFEWQTTIPGMNEFFIKITDVYGKEKTYTFKIFVFENRVPNILWIVENVNNISPLEKKIKVIGDDGDYLWGGQIIYYEYVIDGDTTLYTPNSMNYVFPSEGEYLISVRAKDSDGAWSNTFAINNYLIQP